MGKHHTITREQIADYIATYRTIVASAAARGTGRKRLVATLHRSYIVEVDGTDVHVGNDLDKAIEAYNEA